MAREWTAASAQPGQSRRLTGISDPLFQNACFSTTVQSISSYLASPQVKPLHISGSMLLDPDRNPGCAAIPVLVYSQRSACSGSTRIARRCRVPRTIRQSVALRCALRVWSLLIWAVQNSSARWAALGVGAKSATGNTGGAGAEIRSVVIGPAMGLTDRRRDRRSPSRCA